MIRILCVEDNDDNLYVLHRRLSRAGFEVKVATDGTTGVQWARTLLPDLIVMDLNLPKLDGTEATRRLKSQPETRHIPVIVLTSYGDDKHYEQALAAGADAYETKPADFERLVAKIHSLVGQTPSA
jgi:CheY-like chemotaxis protein